MGDPQGRTGKAAGQKVHPRTPVLVRGPGGASSPSVLMFRNPKRHWDGEGGRPVARPPRRREPPPPPAVRSPHGRTACPAARTSSARSLQPHQGPTERRRG